MLKTPENEMPQVEYWGRDIGINSDETSLTQQDELPDTILCYNGGAKLTCEGSESLEDLKDLAARGVEILTCGTCLNFYGITEKLQVGSVTNMYDIVERMSSADRVIKP